MAIHLFSWKTSDSLCVVFQDSRWMFIQFPLSWFCRANELQNRPTKCWFLNTESSDFDKNIPLYDFRLELGRGQEIFGNFLPQNVTFCSIFVLFSCIEVLKCLLLFEVDWFSGSTSKVCPFCVKMSVFEISRLLGRGDQPFCQDWELFCKKLETGLINCGPCLHSLKKCFVQIYCNILFFAGKCCLLYSQIT